MSRQLFSTGSVWEPIVGCSRAVRVGPLLTITACGPLAADGKTTAAPDPYGQAKRCLEIIARVIADAGFSLDDVVKSGTSRSILTTLRSRMDSQPPAMLSATTSPSARAR